MKSTHRMTCRACMLALGLSLTMGTAAGHPASDVAGSAPLQLEWDARLRQEQVDDDRFSRDASATTLRMRLGLRANLGDGWSGLLEGVGVGSAGKNYNSGANGRTTYPGITDPQVAALNQAWLGWQGETFGAVLGRQRLQLDNQRWVGNSGWRQFEQTFDAVTLNWHPAADWTLGYNWLDRVHRVAGPQALNPLARERKLDTSLFHAAYRRRAQTWTGYAYLHEDRDVPTASTATYGLRWTGSRLSQGVGPGWALEFARQRDYANNPGGYTTSYWLLEPAWITPTLTAKLGWEHLGGNGQHALQTPLATMHAFNGWNDQFNVTPPGGLEDRYLGVNGKFGRGAFAGKLAWAIAWHDYRADRGGRYGSEWDASLGLELAQGLSGLLKVANYHADGFARDSARLWLQLEWKGRQPPR